MVIGSRTPQRRAPARRDYHLLMSVDTNGTRPPGDGETKSGRNPFSDRVSIGRSRTNDIILLSPQVSKLHAHFLRDGEAWDLRDVGSSNGTFVNGARLASDQRARLAYGDILRFGVLDTCFLDGSRLYDWLKKQ